MDIHEQDSFPRAPRALSIVTAIVIAAGFAMVAAWFALLMLDERRTVSRAPDAGDRGPACRICGVVDRVTEIEPVAGQALEGSRAESTVLLIAALGGARIARDRAARIYETSVLHDDGSVRVLRDTGAPQWKPGDRVKVIRGRVEPDALPGGRTSIPGPQAARGW